MTRDIKTVARAMTLRQLGDLFEQDEIIGSEACR